MRALFAYLAITLLGSASAFAALPHIPSTNEVVRYERDYPVFQSKTIPREQGDALLCALDGGRQVREWDIHHGVGVGAYYKVGHEVICALPVPPQVWLDIVLTNGDEYRIGIGDGFVDLPAGRYEVAEGARTNVVKIVAELHEDLRNEIKKAPRPVSYTVGTVDDGSTLSGIARLFYKDATKWRVIYDANRKTIKNPNIITRGMRLTIPKLQ